MQSRRFHSEPEGEVKQRMFPVTETEFQVHRGPRAENASDTGGVIPLLAAFKFHIEVHWTKDGKLNLSPVFLIGIQVHAAHPCCPPALEIQPDPRLGRESGNRGIEIPAQTGIGPGIGERSEPAVRAVGQGEAQPINRSIIGYP